MRERKKGKEKKIHRAERDDISSKWDIKPWRSLNKKIHGPTKQDWRENIRVIDTYRVKKRTTENIVFIHTFAEKRRERKRYMPHKWLYISCIYITSTTNMKGKKKKIDINRKKGGKNWKSFSPFLSSYYLFLDIYRNFGFWRITIYIYQHNLIID